MGSWEVAVAAGTIMAADMSRRLGWISEQDVNRVRQLFVRAGLPVVAPKMGAEKYIQLMGMDKKIVDGQMRFVLLKALGHAVISSEVPVDMLRATLEFCSEQY